MKRWFFESFVLFIVFLTLSGCASVVYGTKQRLAISSEPAKVTARVGTQECQTPCVLTISRKADKIFLEKDGKTKEFELEKGFNGFAAIGGNILWLVPGIVVDVVTGGAFNIENAKLNINGATVTIEDKGSPPEPAAPPDKPTDKPNK